MEGKIKALNKELVIQYETQKEMVVIFKDLAKDSRIPEKVRDEYLDRINAVVENRFEKEAQIKAEGDDLFAERFRN